MSGANSSKKPGIHDVRYGKVVKVHGGHILRSIPRKDGHSKVLTSKGARDRRFRLSASTAIQFYDVQDRLGYDRPGKVVDWLIDKAKAAIEHLPAAKERTEQEKEHQQQGSNCEPKAMNDDSFKEAVVVDGDGDDPYELSQVNYCEEAFDSASNHSSESKVMEMAQMQGWFQSLMAGWNYNAGEAGEVCPFNSSHVSFQYPY